MFELNKKINKKCQIYLLLKELTLFVCEVRAFLELSLFSSVDLATFSKLTRYFFWLIDLALTEEGLDCLMLDDLGSLRCVSLAVSILRDR